MLYWVDWSRGCVHKPWLMWPTQFMLKALSRICFFSAIKVLFDLRSKRADDNNDAGFANAVRLFYCGKAKLGGFALIISQTFVGGNIGHGKTGELQRPKYASVLRILHDLVQGLGKSDRI